jgi:hypothetical protein
MFSWEASACIERVTESRMHVQIQDARVHGNAHYKTGNRENEKQKPERLHD